MDFDYSQFKPTREDRITIDFLRSANPKIKDAPLRDISEKIVNAEKEISNSSKNLGLEADAAINYLKFGLENCYELSIGDKEKNWPKQCQECPKNSAGKSSCSLIRNPLPRTLNSLRKYAAALDYLINLKNPKSNTDAVDLVFKAFELTGAYQKLLNPLVLRQDYHEQNPKMMKDVAESLKRDFRQKEDFIITSLKRAKAGEIYDDFYEYEGASYADYSKLNLNQKRLVTKLDPFNDLSETGLSWVKDMAQFYKKLHKLIK